MLLVKTLIVCISILLSLCVSCSSNGPARYSITDSKAYEASLFRQNCAICHGPEADGKTLEDGRTIPNLRRPPFKYSDDQRIYDHIANGGNGMVPFRGQLSEREIRQMVELVQKDLRQNAARAH